MDRRVIAAIVLMMAIAMLPSVIFKRPPRPVAVDSLAVAVPTETQAPPPTLSGIPPQAPFAEAAAPVVEARTVPVTTPLARYLVSTRGARLVEATLGTYPSLTPADQRVAAQILPKDDDLLGLQLVSGRDTLSLRDWDFTPSVDALAIAEDTPLVLTASRQGVEVELSYRFAAEDYLILVTGQIRGLGPNGGTLLVGLGRGLRNTEVDSTEHQRELAVVTKARSGTSKEGFGGLDKGVST
ncbi:MAG: YidC/Oxa1 family insertase periplasmic-domain containing protein, partial [Gemmatimonadota bacterium]